LLNRSDSYRITRRIPTKWGRRNGALLELNSWVHDHPLNIYDLIFLLRVTNDTARGSLF